MKKEKIKTKEQRISCLNAARSLHFLGEELFDWLGSDAYSLTGGGTRYHGVHLFYEFDAAAMSQDGRYLLIYERLGTKGVLFMDGKFVREISRSYYQAHRYDYPVALFTLPDGRGVIAHCPDEYNRIEIDEIATGSRLTASTERDPADFFHSRLAASRDGRYLISAGWVWQPADDMVIFDVNAAIADPKTLDNEGIEVMPPSMDAFNVTFDRDETGVMMVFARESYDPQVQHPGQTSDLVIYDLRNTRNPSTTPLNTPVGDLMPVGGHHLLVLSEIPRLLDRNTGGVVQEWPQLELTVRSSAITWRGIENSVYALDTAGQRCAIAKGKEIVVLQFDAEPESPA